MWIALLSGSAGGMAISAFVQLAIGDVWWAALWLAFGILELGIVNMLRSTQ